jgi:hypothetical protein
MWMNLLFCLLIIYPSSEAKPQRVKRATSAERQLINAERYGNIGQVQDLLNQRTDIDAADSDQKTALHWAATVNNPMDRRMLSVFEFDSNTLKAELKWSDDSMKTVHLQRVSNEFCFYRGSFDDEAESVILLTGCQNKLKSIQIQSEKYGDTLGTTMTGNVDIVQGVDLSGDIVGNNPSSETNTEENSHGKRSKRGSVYFESVRLPIFK